MCGNGGPVPAYLSLIAKPFKCWGINKIRLQLLVSLRPYCFQGTCVHRLWEQLWLQLPWDGLLNFVPSTRWNFSLMLSSPYNKFAQKPDCLPQSNITSYHKRTSLQPVHCLTVDRQPLGKFIIQWLIIILVGVTHGHWWGIGWKCLDRWGCLSVGEFCCPCILMFQVAKYEVLFYIDLKTNWKIIPYIPSRNNLLMHFKFVVICYLSTNIKRS